ncbi:metal ABC transporter substrate-binding protein [Filifactor alocis]|uniref:metal ABC transporter substrate-binding protein n=1 Tax=Filifactor alocis TaxID=143361 RepID=UPI003C6FB2C5
MKRFWNKALTVALITTMGLSVFAGCGTAEKTEPNNTEGKKLQVYTSFYPMYDFTSKIAGDKVDVINLVPSGTEPHDWEPSTEDIANLEKADMIIYNGAGMEHWVDDVTKSLSNKDIVLVEASEGIDLMEGHHHHDDEGEEAHDHESEEAHEHEGEDADEHEHGLDPHVWTSIKNAKKEMENIKNALVKADAANAEYYEANFKMYSEKFDELDKKYETEIAKLPNKNIVVSHEAFGYLCKEYGLTQVGIEGLSPDSEPNPKRMAEIVEFVEEHNVKVIFFEELVSPKVAESVAKETGATTDVLNPIEGLTEEQLKEGNDYISIMEQNLNSIVKALQ